MATPKPAANAKTAAASAKSVSLTTGWAALVIALLTVIFFRDVLLMGKTFVAPDANAPAGFVRIGEQMLWKQHVYPLWNPYVFLGMPSFGSGAYNPLMYPPDWPLALLGKVVHLPDMAWLVLYYFLGAFFFFQLAREWGARAEGALLGAMAFMFAPNLVAVGSNGHGSQLVDSAYLPLLLWLAARWLRRGNLADLGWLVLAGGFQFLRGHVQVCFYTWMAVVLYGAVEVVAALRTPAELLPRVMRAVGLGVGAALAFGVAGVYNLPLKDYAQYSIRGGTDGSGGVGMAYATQWSMSPFELPAVVWPSFAGFGGATYWGAMPFTDYPNAFMGVVAVMLALPSLVLRGRRQVFAIVLGLFSLGVSFGHNFPLYGFLYDHLPQFKKFRVPVMAIVLFQLAVALGAAWGWSAMLDEGAARDPRKAKGASAAEKLLLAAAGVVVLVSLVLLAGGEGLRGAYSAYAMAHKSMFSAEQAATAFAMLQGEAGKVLLLGLAVAALGWLALRGRIPAGAASIAVLVVLLVDLWPVSARVMSPTIGDSTPVTLDAGRDDTVDFLESAGPPGSFRVIELGGQPGNRLAGFAIGTVSGYHAAKPRLFQDLREPDASPALNTPTWLALLNVRFVLLPRVVPEQQLPQWLKLVHEGNEAVYENMIALPRISVVSQYAIMPDTGRAVVDSIAAAKRDPRVFTYLAKDPHVALGPVEGALADIFEYGLHKVRVRVSTPGPGLLRLADLWYPDWRATVDGKPTEIYRADHLLRAVVVPAGTHTVEFRYESASVRTGMMLTLGSAALAVLMLVAGLWMGRRSRTPDAAAVPAGGEG